MMEDSALDDYLKKYEEQRDARLNALTTQQDKLTKTIEMLVQKFVPHEDQEQVQKQVQKYIRIVKND